MNAQPDPMTPAEFESAMRELFESPYDPEESHGEADDLICELLDALGYGEGVKHYRDGTKWYA